MLWSIGDTRFGPSNILLTAGLYPGASPSSFTGFLTPLRLFHHSTAQYSTALWSRPLSLLPSVPLYPLCGVLRWLPLIFWRLPSSKSKDNTPQGREHVNCHIMNPLGFWIHCFANSYTYTAEKTSATHLQEGMRNRSSTSRKSSVLSSIHCLSERPGTCDLLKKTPKCTSPFCASFHFGSYRAQKVTTSFLAILTYDWVLLELGYLPLSWRC